MTESTKRWQKKVKDLEAALDRKVREFALVNQDKIEIRAKLERYEQAEKASNRADMVGREKLEDELRFLRELVRDLTIDPDVIKAQTNKAIREQEVRSRERRQMDKEFRAQQAHEAQMEKLRKNKAE